ncbi:tRNA (guanosine(46)-N7)-methyltransferase TrmB [Bombilactobacillus folatiphilus]|uniref:tRNA (guanine-N(7)-)-methyltransferase n=1 Tax=Bombilactobacillus folatiphilus TaxID=2923362 RepID=A0ABY4PA70_9LACO|nr:tRNA (guanosine(46)-N7)-methyltransferase TrmB [Bombilactobacillus folatiphilus]UQS82638.1 tRNA (guanosine(46)-N7)-methyltransferase TrmB [Bombilactobacillus folatiphilus]
MRLRNKPWAKDLIQAHPEAILDRPLNMAGHWQQRFNKVQPLELELGSGKGQFIIEKAHQNPDHNFIAMELQTAAAAMILHKQVAAKLPNLQILIDNGQKLTELFKPGEIAKIYLNFSDPWPKSKHTKRRLTSPNFLKLYQQVLPPKGQLEFKTDNQGLFEYSLVSLTDFGMQLEQVSLDLHASELQATNILTEYEEKFAGKGQRIYYLAAHFSA